MLRLFETTIDTIIATRRAAHRATIRTACRAIILTLLLEAADPETGAGAVANPKSAPIS